MLVGVIADTHGLLRAEVAALLQRSDRIIHAGDVGSPEILGELKRLAPTFAVRGNADRGEWASQLPVALTVTWNGVTIYVLHDQHDLPVAPVPAGTRVVITGHSHKARVEEKDGVTYLNPGSVGPRRFRLPVTMAWLHLPGKGQLRIEPVTLPV